MWLKILYWVIVVVTLSICTVATVFKNYVLFQTLSIYRRLLI
mgnify:CR=1 FL=1